MAVPAVFKADRPLVFAHRGGARLAPENTMAAIDNGMALGSDGLEIDVHWVQRAGLDPVATLLAYGERVSLIHLKDFRIGTLPDSAFAKLAEGDAAGYKFDFLNLVQFAEIGEGNLNFPAIIAASEQTAASHLLVEQDELYGRSALECLAISYDNLLRLGYADLF